MTGSLFGSSPKVVQSGPQPTTSGAQQQLMAFLTSLLMSGATPPGVQGYTGQFGAPQTSQQTGVVNQLAQLASELNPGANAGTAAQVPQTLSNQLNFQAPQVSAPQVSFSPQTPTIDSTQAFQQGVVQPVTSNFLQTVIPQLNAGAGRSAGGAYSSDLQGSTDQALTNLNQTLTSAGSQFAYNAAAANQSAQETTNSLLAQIAEANQSAQEATNSLDVGSTLSGAGVVNQALGLSPTALSAPYTQAGDVSSILTSLFPTLSTPQTTQQTQLSGQYADFLNQLQQKQGIEQLIASLSVSPTESSTTVAQGGSTGLIPGLLTGAAGNAGLATALFGAGGLLASDERVKTDIRRVGRLEGRKKLPVYTFRYKSDPSKVRRIGVLAQEAERLVPSAVHDIGGVKHVNYAELLDKAFPEAA